MALPTNSIKKYLKSKYERQNIYARYSNGKMIYWVNNRWVNEEEYNKAYPEYNFIRYSDLGLDNPNLIFIA